ncbi:glucose dehydrogenase [FAD, quinone]-like [Nylanderia fulva]|uniref:glucose dehydrogenase [FAD, quinone]-like n=1 Tax=Nylanderia fulva TaxID=613905 RepID=UPI0010FBA404|nr:glucose dehydrogenase [FAD, quinone]-like [Nylanderia fulva]
MACFDQLLLTTPIPMQMFLMLLGTMIVIYRPDIVDVENSVQSTKDLSSEYDFVIIGGGSAGCVLANRLSENYTVLLLEAGGNEEYISDIPYTVGSLMRTPYDWNYTTVPSPNYCLSMNGHNCFWSRGKVLGGCSVVGAWIYTRGNKKDYDSWASLGNEGWDYDNVLQYFKISEDMRDEELVNSFYHGTRGYLPVETFKYNAPIDDCILRAGEDMGYKIQDLNGANRTGFSLQYGTLRDGLGCSTAKAFLRPISKRKNLNVSLNSFVEKILVIEDSGSKVAFGVLFRRDQQLFKIKAKHEVILSAGSINSPQLLMLSGIGPRKHLQEMNIPVVHDAPGVGQNLQDHVGMTGISIIIDPSNEINQSASLTTNCTAVADMESIIELMQKNCSSPLYSNVLSGGIAFVYSKFADRKTDWPDIQLEFSSCSDYSCLIGGLYNMKEEDINALSKNIADVQGYGVSPQYVRPESRGYIELNSSDPIDPSKIFPNYFKNPRDLETLVASVEIIKEIVRTPTMQKLNARLNTNKLPECSQYDISTDDYWRCYARHATATNFHSVGTCKMGLANDSYAVVDSRLRVYGIKKLRVIDASIMPHIVSGNTNAPTIMIAEKGAAMIKEDCS